MLSHATGTTLLLQMVKFSSSFIPLQHYKCFIKTQNSGSLAQCLPIRRHFEYESQGQIDMRRPRYSQASGKPQPQYIAQRKTIRIKAIKFDPSRLPGPNDWDSTFHISTLFVTRPRTLFTGLNPKFLRPTSPAIRKNRHHDTVDADTRRSSPSNILHSCCPTKPRYISHTLSWKTEPESVI